MGLHYPMHRKRVTLKTMANMLGMTTATISKALRDGNDISESTREKVKALADKLGYQPNLMARNLVRRRTHFIGTIIPDLRISFFSEVTRGIYEFSRQYGYESILMVNDESSENEKRNLDFFSALHVDGILIDIAPDMANIQYVQRLQKQGIPIVAYDRIIEGLNVSSVTIDDERAAFDVTEKFIKEGKKKIMYLGRTDQPTVAKFRFLGYKKALKKNKLPIRPELILCCQIDASDAQSKMCQAMEVGIVPDAVICVGGLVAYGAGRAILSHNYSIPNDVTLAEFGDNDIVARLGVPFVTVNQFPYKMGRKAAQLLIDIISARASGEPINEFQKVLIDTEVVLRTLN